jgi:hypothetical protein
MKIRVGLPSFNGKLRDETQQTLERLKACKKHEFEVIQINGGCIYRGRNSSSLAVPCLNGGKIKQTMPYDYYLAMDWDMSFSAETIHALITWDKDIICAAYGDRNGQNDLLVAGHWDKVPGDSPMIKRLKFYETGLKEVDWTGAGCLLIKKNVFETLEYPYWTHNIIRVEDCQEVVAEDISFCMNAKAAGFKVWLDCDHRAAHLAHPQDKVLY